VEVHDNDISGRILVSCTRDDDITALKNLRRTHSSTTNDRVKACHLHMQGSRPMQTSDVPRQKWSSSIADGTACLDIDGGFIK
jgi:hypothetical protein